ncbi:ABC transporter ATP-binding protein [Paludifilum halophilum]|uniref:3-dehydroquinate dehydratase n=1 Tax=Paludifilum halophilum TaxID=1642702 RepID=A0A235B3V5_9BACL|nr:ABC transporter ATP-binding protein [Paludifilum halophilum]OYD06990.1 3-dehydroquinate dehydratase [Paludifilum halophilum]
MIWLGNVSKSYGKSGVPAVDRLQLTVSPGEIFGFLGPNGAGKTTTIKMIAGIIQPDTGVVEVDHTSVSDRPLEAKRKIGYVPDSPEPFAKLTGREYIQFMADIYQVPLEKRQKHLPGLLERFGMEENANQLIQGYSRGMKQKITLIATLLHEPSVWILDEPMVGLDPRASAVLKEEMRRHCDRGNTVFFSTHVLEVAERLCDRVAILNEGRLVSSGKLEDLRRGSGHVSDENTLENLFMGLTES